MKVIVPMLFGFGVLSVAIGQFNQAPFLHCFNPNNNPGLCVPIYECETVMSIIYRQHISQVDREFIRASECLNVYHPMRHVCCTTDTGFSRQKKSTASPIAPHWESPKDDGFFSYNDYDNSDDTHWPRFGDFGQVPSDHRKVPNDASSLPEPPTCGGVTIQNKIYGGSDAAFKEFPWMVILEYERMSLKNGKRIAMSCGGSLINQRYVLTAAHCVRGAIEKKIGPVVAVRLGEHDTSRKIDCNGYGSCAPEITRVGFDEIIAHEQYKDSSTNKQYDIALIRLDRTIHFSDSISPVCLPSALKARSIADFSSKTGTELTAAGWGQTLQSSESPIKQKVMVPLVDHKKCQKKFREARVNIVDSQLCAGAKFAEDSCNGDSGGPLMHFRGGVWVLEGIISFGYRCGLVGWPGVYTRIASFEDWIRNKLRP